MKTDFYKNYTTTSVLTDVNVDKFTNWSHLYFKKYILPHIPLDKSCKILEVGCGYGRYTSLLTNKLGYTNVVGIDISEEQIQFAKKQYNLENVFLADALVYLEDESKKYDIIILMDVLEHLELDYAVKLLTSIHAALNRGGNLIIQVPNGLSPMQPIFHGDVTHVRAFSVNSMSQVLRMSNFIRYKHYNLPPLAHGLKSFVLKWIWKLFINPLLYIFMTLSHGSPVGGIYSSNLLTIATV